jgi:hypothetical protein
MTLDILGLDRNIAVGNFTKEKEKSLMTCN